MTGADANMQDTLRAVTTHTRCWGSPACFLGALIATCTGRLMSVSLPTPPGSLLRGFLVVISVMSRVPTQYRQVAAAPVEAI
jgi:hypothetical protein